MLLNVTERTLLLNEILPKQGNLLTLRVVKELIEHLDFTMEEMAEAGFKQEGTQLRWDPSCPMTKEVPVSTAAAGVIVEQLNRLESAKQLTFGLMSLFERFVEHPEAKEPPPEDGA